MPGTDPRTTFVENENENRDPFVLTPPRKRSPTINNHSTTPATPKSKSTPLHKRFLEEVTMASGTPPRTPSKSPRRGQTKDQTLEVGQNGFYFSIEIPEKKITPSRTGRVTPSPEKLGGMEKKSDMKTDGSVRGAGGVKDILRKNLFGTPTKKATKPERNGQDQEEVKKGIEVKMSLPHDDGKRTWPSYALQPSDGSGSANAQNDTMEKTATEHATTPSATQGSSTIKQPSAPPHPTIAHSIAQKSSMPPDTQQTPETLSSTPAPTTGTPAACPLNLQKGTTTSTPSNIGHLMAGLSNKSSKVQILPIVSGSESMPTPLRKMSEKLGLKSPNVIRRVKVNEVGQINSAVALKSGMLKSPIPSLDLRDAAPVENGPAKIASAGEVDATTALAPAKRANEMRREYPLAQLLGSPIAVVSPLGDSRPSTATTASYAFPSTPSRPGPPIRAQSFGTPARLRSSIQEDMYKVQESLKRSLGQDFILQTNGTRPATPMSPTVAAASPRTSTMDHSRSHVKKATRPVSMVRLDKSNDVSSTQAVPRRPLNTAARKPRPKSMIVGSAKVLETVASQIDSPRERAKLRSAAAASSSVRSGPTTSRPGTVASTSRGPVSATTLPALKPQPTVRMTKSAALRAAAHPKRVAASTSTATLQPQKQRVASAEAIANRVAEWKEEEDRKDAVPKIPMRTKSTKTPSKLSKPAVERNLKTPEPKDPEASYTPPGNPTRLPSPAKSPSKTRLIAPPVTPASKKGPPPSHVAHLRTPFPAKTPVNSRVVGIGEKDPNALRTPSKEIESSLDRAIDEKIKEDKRRWEGVFAQWGSE